jgi:hypothetical protein
MENISVRNVKTFWENSMKRVTSVRQHLKTNEDVLTFGKYKDFTVTEVLAVKPDYLEWCLDEKVITCEKIVEDAIQDKLTYR